jgi:tRNA A-37 threonylcarbamoyl transferase component Bud32
MAARFSGYDLQPGRRLGSHYEVAGFLGQGWEGEVYKVVETATGIERAVKIYFPERNPRGRTLLRYARKLNKLKDVPIIIQYHHRDTARIHGRKVEFMVSDYVDGELLSAFLAHQRGKRLQPFEALHVLHALASGVAPIHRMGEYHGDIHSDNVMVRRKGIGFEVKLIDFFDLGRPTRERIRDDVVDMAAILHEMIGGQRHYARTSRAIKAIVCGQKRSLIHARYPTADALVSILDTLEGI